MFSIIKGYRKRDKNYMPVIIVTVTVSFLLLLTSAILYMFFNKRFQKGFTILELLVVIAVIGILATIVFAAVNGARAKGADKAIISDLASLRTEAGLFYSNNGETYGSYNSGNAPGITAHCPSTLTATPGSLFDAASSTNAQVINNALKDANKQSINTFDAGGRYQSARCIATGSTWAVAVALKTNTGRSWCVDSNGTAKEVSNSAATSNLVFNLTGTTATCGS